MKQKRVKRKTNVAMNMPRYSHILAAGESTEVRLSTVKIK